VETWLPKRPPLLSSFSISVVDNPTGASTGAAYARGSDEELGIYDPADDLALSVLSVFFVWHSHTFGQPLVSSPLDSAAEIRIGCHSQRDCTAWPAVQYRVLGFVKTLPGWSPEEEHVLPGQSLYQMVQHISFS
jgi:hypothetical protein